MIFSHIRFVGSTSVKKDDLGKVIGKKGRTVKAMRILLEAFGKRQSKRYALEIVEPTQPANEEAASDDTSKEPQEDQA